MLATALDIDLDDLQPVLGETRVGFSTLRACGMLTRRGGSYYLHIAGAGRIYPAPMPNGLLSIEEARLLYDVQVEKHQPEEEILKRMRTKRRSKRFLIKRSSHKPGSPHTKISKDLEELWRGCTTSL